MPYRARSTDVWLNMPGVVAAWQPVAAPGPLLARYNQAGGGSNRYKATDGTPPAWGATTGWTFVKASSQHLIVPGLVPAYPFTVFVRFSVSGNTAGALIKLGGTGDGVALGVGATTFDSSGAYLVGLNEAIAWAGTGIDVLPNTVYVAAMIAPASGAGELTYYWDGIYRQVVGGVTRYAVTTETAIGGYPTRYIDATISAACLVLGAPSAVEIWQISRQMAYCHVNPDWSAWGRRRRYYYAPYEPPPTADDIRSAAAGVGAFGPRLGGAARLGHQQAAELPAAARAGHRSRLNG